MTVRGQIETLGQAIYVEDRPRFLETAAPIPHTQMYSQETAREIDCAVRELVGRAYQTACGILERHRPTLSEMAVQLLEKETRTKEEIPTIPEEARVMHVTG